MASAASQVDLPASPADVWALIGGFGSLTDWLPFIKTCELRDGGRLRHFTVTDGSVMTEKLLSYDDEGRTYTYTIHEGPLPVTAYRSTIVVSPAQGGTGSHVDWWGEFTPNGVSEEAATAPFRGIYENGLKALASHFARA
jgi:hypothetical protein